MSFNDYTYSSDDTITLFGVDDTCEVTPLDHWELADFQDVVAVDAV